MFRYKKPNRTYTIPHEDYKEYLDPLREDFFCRCGYCNTPDIFFNGSKEFHIDHYKPKGNSKFPQFEKLINKYSNLVYSCPDCNRYKSNQWNETGANWIDPVDVIYDSLFSKKNNGCFTYVSSNINAQYIYIKLRLFSKRKQFINLIDDLGFKIIQLQELNKIKNNPDIKDLIYDLLEYKEIIFNELRYI